jgi:O-6-methylguanine DNA methyltransferase
MDRPTSDPEHTIYHASFSSTIGIIRVASTLRGVCKISIPGSTKSDFFDYLDKQYVGFEILESRPQNRLVIDELSKYLERKLVRFRCRLDIQGTDFQRVVWRELRRIRYGTLITYKELAKRSRVVDGYQAVGRANATNPLPIIIPCHRVVGSRLQLTGYAAGLKTKEFLLRLEGALLV